MKLIVTALVLVQMSVSLGFAQAPKTVGGWSIYVSGNGVQKQTETLIQSTSTERYDNNNGQPVEARLDAICRKGKLVAVALDINSVVPMDSMNHSGPVDTTSVSYEVGSQSSQTEAWAIFDHGRTLSPYAQILQERRTRQWADRIAGADRIVFHFDGSDAARANTATFQTGDFAQALLAAQCSY